MPVPAYLSVTGEHQGLITAGNFTEASVGNIYQEGHEDECLVEAFAHTIMLPRDPQSGQPSGQRVHKALKITKVIDKSSPLLFRALTAGERLPKVEMKFYRTSAAGTMEHYFTIALEDAIIVDITSYMPNCQDPSQEHFTHLEDVSFTYRKIIKTHEIASTSESDDWRAMSTQA
ncbi:MAG: Hcp family type VI secretion system effector [Desulfovibrio sp.]|nr:Hcp family type VI secretion system effector [Desulfovibrio sp.]